MLTKISRGVVLVLGLLIFCTALAFAQLADHVVISEFLVDSSGAESDYEFVELHNPTNQAVDISNWDIAYESATFSAWSAVATIPASSTIPAHGYFLIGGNLVYPFPDLNDTSLGFAATGGHIAVRDDINTVIDFVGYGTADTPEGSAASAPPTDQTLERKSGLVHNENEGNGWDTNNNSVDFFVQSSPNPQNSSNSTEEYRSTRNVCDACDYITIQSAIDAASPGDIINVSAGNYTEDLTITTNNLELVGADKATTKIKGIANVPAASWPLAVPNIDVQADGVKIHGFTIEGPAYEAGKYVSGMVMDGQNIEIYDNDFMPTKVDTPDEYGQAIITYSKTAIPTADVSGLNIHDNTFTGSGLVGVEAIYVNPHTGSGTITINNNQISGSVNIGITVESGNAIVSNNTVNTDVDPESGPYGTYGIRFFDSTYVATYDNIVISDNNVQNFKRGVRVGNGGAGTSAITATVLFNTLTNNVIGIWARQYGADITATNNSMEGNTFGVKNDDNTTTVNATYNYWGHESGPGGAGYGLGDNITSNVDYYPWYEDSALTTLFDTPAEFGSTIESITIENLTQEDYPIQINVTLINTGPTSALMYNASIYAKTFQDNPVTQDDFANTSTAPQNCGTILPGSSCTKTFNVVVKGGTPNGTYYIDWAFNWTNIDGSFSGEWYGSNAVTISNYPVMNVIDNITKTISHGTNLTFNTNINSTGNGALTNVNISYTPANLSSDWVSFSPTTISSIAAGSYALLSITITIPKGTSPGNYIGEFTISADSVSDETILLIVTVPTDNSWFSYPTETIIFRKTNVAGILGTVYINNTGNVDQNYTISYTGYIRTQAALWNISNPTNILVSKQTTDSFDVSHLGYWQAGSYSLNVAVNDGSTSSTTVMNLILENTPPSVSITYPLADSSVSGLVDFNVTATDNFNLSKIEFYINNVLVFDDMNLTKTYSWNTSAETDGPYTLKATAYDAAGNYDSSEINVTVNNVRPTLHDYLPTNLTPTVAENSSLSFFVNATDPQGGLLNYTWILDDVINQTDGNNFTYYPGFYDAGNHTVNVNITDNNSDTITQSWSVIVTDNNRKPVIQAQIEDREVVEDSGLVSFDITTYFNDSDLDNTLTYVISNENVSEVNCSIVGDNLTFIPAANFAGVGADATSCSVQAYDGTDYSDNNTFSINVTNVNDLPVITSYSPTNLDPKIADLTESITFSITKSDADGVGTLNVSWYIDGTVNETDVDSITLTGLDAADYDVYVLVNDSINTTKQEWTLTVSAVPVSQNYTGTIKQLTEQQLENATNVTIEEETYGKIDFGNNVLNLTDVVDLDNAIKIEAMVVGIDTERYPQLNKPAHIVMKGLGATSTPTIYYNPGFGVSGNTICPTDRCTNIDYEAANGVLEFDVSGFSTYFVTENIAPVADAGEDQYVSVNELVTLDGSGSSDENVNDTLTYAWSQVGGPNVILSNYTTQKPTFTPTEEGTYIFQLIVNDGTIDSQPNNVTVIAYGGVLDITDVKVKSVGKNRKLKPGEKLTVEVDIENKGDIDIEDIKLELWFEDADGNKLEDDDNDIIEDDSEFDLDEGEDEDDLDEDDVTFEFDMPYDVEDGDTYIVYVRAEGEQSNDSSIRYRDIDNSQTIEFEREKHELVISRAVLNPDMIKCSRDVGIDFGVRDIGEKDEDDVRLTISNNELNVNVIDVFDIEEDPDDNEYKASYAFEVSDEIAEGVYPIFIKLEYDKGDETTTETVNLEVQDCERVKGVKEEVVVQKIEKVRPGVSVAEPVKPPVTRISFTETPEYLIVLTLGLIILTGLVIFAFGAVIISLRKK